MSKLTKVLSFVGLACSGAILYFCYKQRIARTDHSGVIPNDKQDNPLLEGCRLVGNLEKRVVDGNLNFQDVVSWFKKIENLNQAIDTPFIARAKDFCELLDCVPSKTNSVFIGVYNNKLETITHALLLETDHLDSKTKEILGNESLVVLQ